MLWLLSILSGTILYVDCPNPEVLWYFNHLLTNNIFICKNNWWNTTEVKLHEIWHMYQYRITGYTDEKFADIFAKCWLDRRCHFKLQALITKTLDA